MLAVFLSYYCVPLLLFLLFFVAYKINRTNLITSFLFTCALITFVALFSVRLYDSGSRAGIFVFGLIALVFLFVLFFGAYIIAGFLILNTILIFRKERRNLKHSLTLFLALGILLLALVPYFVNFRTLSPIVANMVYSVYGLIFYYIIHIIQYIIGIVLCNFSRPKKNQDYIIVLGCWLRDGKATPLLARRIDRAIGFYNNQKKKRSPPKLILSGGKGADELRPEAEGMKEYAMEKGIPEEDLLLEPESASTLENMKFSRAIMERESGGKPYKCIYSTNNYHVLRAGIYARRAGLKINGIGAKTAFYFLPNAILREYAAYLLMHMKWNITFAGVSLLLGNIVIPILLRRIAPAG
ncbi:MAG: YdcF family protein [Oscillospiraceae bacterium]|nr:YdcF family protein [Oscillospiraceae bacterium]